SASELGLAMPDCLRGHYAEDPFFILDKITDYEHFVLDFDVLYTTKEDVRRLCIPDILV
ncbi:hypothetical protein GY45DRAFT_1211930, partial [Cubamyces sp. BRFM 1775]